MNNLSKVSNTQIYNIEQITERIISEKVLVNYDMKTKYMVDDKLMQSDINEFLSFINYCFLVKNNFFVDNFDFKSLKYIYIAYNSIKSNILDKDCIDLFKGLDITTMKTLNFIVRNLIFHYDDFELVNIKMSKYISLDGMKRFKDFIDLKLNFLEINNTNI